MSHFHVALNGNTVTGVQLADGTPLAGFTAAEDGTVTLPAATLQALAAGDYTLYVTYAPLGVAYNARYEASEGTGHDLRGPVHPEGRGQRRHSG